MYASVTLCWSCCCCHTIRHLTCLGLANHLSLSPMNLWLPAEGCDSHWSLRRPLLLLWLWEIVKSHKRLHITDMYMFSHLLFLLNRKQGFVFSHVWARKSSFTGLTTLPFKKPANTLIATLSFHPYVCWIWHVIKFSPIVSLETLSIR